jgi:hypothetical protein
LYPNVDGVFCWVWYAVTAESYLWTVASKNRSGQQVDVSSPDTIQFSAGRHSRAPTHFLLRKNRRVLASVWSCRGSDSSCHTCSSRGAAQHAAWRNHMQQVQGWL